MIKFFKKLLPITLALFMMFSTNTLALAMNNSTDLELESAYKSIMSYADDNNLPVEMTFEDFVNGYEEQEYKNVQEYSNTFYSLLQPEPSISLSSSGGKAWYYNIGETLPDNAEPDYSRYNLLDTVKKGDIIFEANGGFGITGHIAIVEGLYYNKAKDVTYIRIVEAIDDGVVRSCLDDTRVDDKDVTIYRVSDATTTNKDDAVSFCVGELGSSYNLDFAKDTSSSETDWYCSELVWAAYKNEGINIETTATINEPGVTPRDISRSSEVTSIGFK